MIAENNVWLLEANRKLLNVIRANGKRYAPDVHVSSGCSVTGGPETQRRVARMVAAKNAWALDMDACAINGGVRIDTQREVWLEVMDAAEREIDAMIREFSAGGGHEHARE